eukprot:symbB.v1.2.024455.t1/scaffold2319.1/size82456/4
MFEQPKFFLSCPQCKGKFVSAGTMNQCSPSLILSTREEIDVMIRENEKALAEIEFLDDDSQENETKINDDEEIKKEYSPRDDEMEVSDGQEEEVEIVDVDESDSLEARCYGNRVLRTGLGGPFTLERGLRVTVDEDTLRAFYEDRAKAPGATIDAEERVRRTRVQACNSMSEQTTTEALRFGGFIFMVIGLSILMSTNFLMPLMMLVGPEGDQGKLLRRRKAQVVKMEGTPASE